MLTGESKYVDWCIEWAKQMCTWPVYRDPLGPQGQTFIPDAFLHNRTRCLGYVYDWFYDQMTDEDRQTILDGLIRHIKALSEHPMITGAGHLGGHDRGCLHSLGIALIAAHPDYQDRKLLNRVRTHLHGIYACESHIVRDGGYFMGWGSYTPGYTTINGWVAWTTGTNDVLLDDWMGELAYWYIYGLRGDDLYPPMEDASSTLQAMPIRSGMMLYAVHFAKNPQARWFYEQKGFAGSKDHAWLFKLLFWDPNVAPQDPTELPLSRAFRGCGSVICRDRWDEKTTHFVFRSVPFGGGNHRDNDQNSFVLNYRGELALDSGRFGETPSRYKTNSIAHNCMRFVDTTGRVPPSQGVQVRYPSGRSWKRTINDIVPGGPAYIRGLFRYQNAPEWTYAAGDATKVYNPKLVKLSQRDVVYLRAGDWPRPIVIVFDRNETTGSQIEQRFVLHLAEEPIIADGGRLITAVHGKGKLHMRTAFPPQVRCEPIGGPGKEFWMFAKNYAPARETKNSKQVGGKWRVEIAPAARAARQYMLHALYVADAEDETPPPNAIGFESDTAVAVQTAGWTVVFPKTGEDSATGVSFTVPTPVGNDNRWVVVGLAQNRPIVVDIAGETKTLISGEGGCVQWTGSLAAGAEVKVRSQ